MPVEIEKSIVETVVPLLLALSPSVNYVQGLVDELFTSPAEPAPPTYYRWF